MPDDTDSARLGRWDVVFPLPGVAIHTHLLPNGEVLFWGRRADPTGSMHQPNTAPPYLFCGPRPTLVSPPESVELGATFAVVTDGPVCGPRSCGWDRSPTRST